MANRPRLAGVTFRKARMDDLEALLDGGAECFKDGHPTLVYGYEREKTAKFMSLVMDRFEAINLVAEKDGQIIGAIFGVLLPDFFSSHLLGKECFFAILPAHRSLVLASEMVRHFTKACLQCGATAVEFAPSTDPKWLRYRKFLARMGFEEQHVAMRFKPARETN